MSDTTHAGWFGNTEDQTGTATFMLRGQPVTVRFYSFEEYSRVLDLMRQAREDARHAQADYLRGAINRLLDSQ